MAEVAEVAEVAEEVEVAEVAEERAQVEVVALTLVQVRSSAGENP